MVGDTYGLPYALPVTLFLNYYYFLSIQKQWEGSFFNRWISPVGSLGRNDSVLSVI